MKEAPENGKELLHSAHANGMEWNRIYLFNYKNKTSQKPEIYYHI
jgi:hypothetical protein